MFCLLKVWVTYVVQETTSTQHWLEPTKDRTEHTWQECGLGSSHPGLQQRFPLSFDNITEHIRQKHTLVPQVVVPDKHHHQKRNHDRRSQEVTPVHGNVEHVDNMHTMTTRNTRETRIASGDQKTHQITFPVFGHAQHAKQSFLDKALIPSTP